jgi:hypothetical protein
MVVLGVEVVDASFEVLLAYYCGDFEACIFEKIAIYFCGNDGLQIWWIGGLFCKCDSLHISEFVACCTSIGCSGPREARIAMSSQ